MGYQEHGAAWKRRRRCAGIHILDTCSEVICSLTVCAMYSIASWGDNFRVFRDRENPRKFAMCVHMQCRQAPALCE